MATKKSIKTKEAKPKNNGVLVEGILAEKSRRGEVVHYSYISRGLPKLRAKAVWGWSPFFEKRDAPAKK